VQSELLVIDEKELLFVKPRGLFWQALFQTIRWHVLHQVAPIAISPSFNN
jgi:hypothetical protein